MPEPTQGKDARRGGVGKRGLWWRSFFVSWILWSGYWVHRLRVALPERKDAAVLELLMWGLVVPIMIAGAAQMFLGRRPPAR